MKKYIIIIVILFLYSVNFVSGQNLEPWVYGNLPVKLNSASVSYVLIDGNFISDPASPIQDFNIVTNKFVGNYFRTFNVFGNLTRVQLTVPYSLMAGSMKLKGKDTSGTRAGFDDISLRFGMNIFGSPPLEPQNFSKYRQEAILGASLVVTFPLGQYYPEKIINLGTNRWGFKPEIGLSLRVDQFFWEIYGGVKFTTKNYEYLINKTLSQSPLYSIQTHICHTFKNNMRIALSSTYVNGGQTTINNFKQNDYIRHLRGGLSFGVSVGRLHLFVLQLNSNITSNASLDYKSLSLTYNYTWF